MLLVLVGGVGFCVAVVDACVVHVVVVVDDDDDDDEVDVDLNCCC